MDNVPAQQRSGALTPVGSMAGKSSAVLGLMAKITLQYSFKTPGLSTPDGEEEPQQLALELR
jgi:hypothetical protein